MTKSMTGFGASEVEADGVRMTVEAKSVNGRFLKVSLKGPSGVLKHEQAIEGIVKQKLRRGSVTLHVFAEYGNPADLVEVDENVALAYKAIFDRLDIPNQNIASLPGVLGGGPKRSLSAAVTDALKVAVGQALDALVATRSSEGAALEEVILGLCGQIDALTQSLEERTPEVVAEYQQRLEQRLENLLSGANVELDPSVVAREVAVLADRADIREELDRLGMHTAHARKLLQQDGESGRTLDFLAQELLREANTVGSKSQDAALAATVVELKTVIERFKEQVANIE